MAPQGMINFPISFEDAVETHNDAAGRSLKTRVRRLSTVIDPLWLDPANVKTIRYFNQRLAKLLRGINHNRLFPQRIHLRAQFVDEADDAPPPDDQREIICLDERRLEESFDAIEHVVTGELPAGHSGEIKKGLGLAILNFFLIHLLRRMERIEHTPGDLGFPANLHARLDNVISTRAPDWYVGTVLLDRLHSLQVMMDIDALNPDDVAKVSETSVKLQNDVLRNMVRKDYIIRMRIFELYHRVRPYILGPLRLKSEEAKEARAIISDLELLLDYVCGLESFPQIRADRKAQLREKIERRLARAIGAPNGNLGWYIYRGLRSRKGRAKFRTEYLFQQLLENDQDRLAVLNQIYAHKKANLRPSHPAYRRLPDLTAGKYQPYFSQKLAFKSSADRFSLVEKPIEIDLGSG